MRFKEFNLSERTAIIRPLVAPIFRGLTKSGTKEKDLDKVAAMAKTQALNKDKQSGSNAAIIFGRFNPPHKGHSAQWQAMASYSYWYVGTNPKTQGPNDPLPYEVKLDAMKAVFPALEGHVTAQQDWLHLASFVFRQHPDVEILTCYTSEDWVLPLLQKYNGKPGPHGTYQFSTLEQKNIADDTRASQMREAVRQGDRKKFEALSGVPENTPVAGKPYFDTVATYMRTTK